MNQFRKTAISLAAAQAALLTTGLALAQIVDSIAAYAVGKLPDKSVTEVPQRIAGVSIDRALNRTDAGRRHAVRMRYAF